MRNASWLLLGLLAGGCGKDGKDGEDGATGTSGPRGEKGEMGDVGPTGPIGPIGPSDPLLMGRAAALAMCRDSDPQAFPSASDAVYLTDGETGNQACASLPVAAPCYDTHYILFHASDEWMEENPLPCDFPADYSNGDVIGTWACCSR